MLHREPRLAERSLRSWHLGGQIDPVFVPFPRAAGVVAAPIAVQSPQAASRTLRGPEDRTLPTQESIVGNTDRGRLPRRPLRMHQPVSMRPIAHMNARTTPLLVLAATLLHVLYSFDA